MSEGARTSRLDLIAAVLLGLAAFATALAAYLASLSEASALEGYTTSDALQRRAADQLGKGDQDTAFDGQLFLQYEVAMLAGDEVVADRIRNDLMSAELREAVEWYETAAPPDAPGPFEVAAGSPYRVRAHVEGERLRNESAATFANARAAAETGAAYDLAVVVLVLSLFFGGIATLIGSVTIQKALLGMSAVALAVGVAQIAVAG